MLDKKMDINALIDALYGKERSEHNTKRMDEVRERMCDDDKCDPLKRPSDCPFCLKYQMEVEDGIFMAKDAFIKNIDTRYINAKMTWFTHKKTKAKKEVCEPCKTHDIASCAVCVKYLDAYGSLVFMSKEEFIGFLLKEGDKFDVTKFVKPRSENECVSPIARECAERTEIAGTAETTEIKEVEPKEEVKKVEPPKEVIEAANLHTKVTKKRAGWMGLCAGFRNIWR